MANWVNNFPDISGDWIYPQYRSNEGRVGMSNSLTRQHFEAFAEAIKKIGGANLRRKVVSFLIPVFQRFNTEFDEERFREAAKAKLQEIVPTSIGPPPPESTWEPTGNILADVEEANRR